MFVTLPNNSDAIINFKVKLLHTGLPKKCYLLTTSVHACLPTYHVWLLEGFWNHRQSYKCLSHVNKNRLALPLFKSQRHQKQWLSFYDLKKVSNISFIKIHSIKYPETIYFLDQQLLGSKSFPQTKDFSSKCDGIYSFLRLLSHFRSSRPELFFKKGVHTYAASSIFYCFFTANALKSFAKFNRKHRLTVFILGKG